MPIKRNASLFNWVPVFCSSIVTGQVEVPVLATSTWLPCLNGSVLLRGNDNLTLSFVISTSHALLCMALSHLRNLANANRLIVVILKFARVGEELASSTISARIGTAIGFFCTGLACNHVSGLEDLWVSTVVEDSSPTSLCT